jgi:tetratricopeptide (TPR) repeat protein
MPIPSDQRHERPRHSSPARGNDEALEIDIGCNALKASQPTILPTTMIRSIILAVGLGALVAAGALYAAAEPGWRSRIAVWLGASEPPPVAKLATEEWPICTTMGSMGSEADWAQLDPDLAAGKKALVAEDWNGAIAALKLAALRDPRNADIQNYIGYAYRRLRQFGPAMQYYQQALVFNRRHRSAHEHLGELYLVLGEPAKAEQQLATLEEICLIPCVETDDLKRAIAAYNTLAAR